MSDDGTTEQEWVATWNEQGREYGGCAMTKSGMGPFGCERPAVADVFGYVLLPLLAVAAVVWVAVDRRRTSAARAAGVGWPAAQAEADGTR